jgi:hypothetical protein
MKYFILTFCIITFSLSCKKEQPLPMEEEKLIKVLCDIHIAEAAMEPVTANDKDSIATLLYQQIYTIHGVEQAEVDTALSFLKKEPQAAEKIYLKVVEELSKMKLVDE